MIREAVRGCERQRCNLYCLPAAVEWFYCKTDPANHLISSLIYDSSQNTDSLSVWESDFKVPSTTQEMAPQTFSCGVMAGLRRASAGLTGERVTKRFWALFQHQPCRTRLTKDINWFDTQNKLWSFLVRIGFCSVLLCSIRNHWGFQNSMGREKRQDKTVWGRGIIIKVNII